VSKKKPRRRSAPAAQAHGGFKDRDPTGWLIDGFPLVRNRLSGDNPAEPAEPGEQATLRGLGFHPGFWLPSRLAARWQTTIYPKDATPEAVASWRELWDRTTLLLCGWEAGRADKAAKILESRRMLDNDLALIREHDPALAPGDDAPPAEVSSCPITSLGDRQYRLGGREPFTVTEAEDNVLQAFIGQPVMDTDTLIRRSKREDAVGILKRVHDRLAKQSPGVKLAMRSRAGGKGRGYYAEVIPAD
jgi:hypothetical protein